MARGVMVDVTAASASEARDRALAEGQLLAFNSMLRNLTAGGDHGRLPPADPATVANMLVGFEIEEEKTSSVRYIARLTYRFDPDSVRDLLQNYGIPFAEGRGRPMVVLPILHQGGSVTLWDETNPWREAWVDQARVSGLVPLVIPIGDLVDISKITAEQAEGGDPTALNALAERYQTTDVLVVSASQSDPTARLDVSASRYGLGGMVPVARTSVDDGGVESLAVAAAAITRELEENWKRQNMVRTDLRGRIDVIVPVQTLSDWTLLRRRLDAIGTIRNARLSHLQRGQAQISLDFVGTIDQLQRTLAQHDLDLRQGLAAWVLSLRGSIALPTQPAAPEAEPLNAPGSVSPIGQQQ
ncbi:MAG: DUF2066 domain-containing protein [Alphaproteobacteria bacterium]|nr:DUF2066 domain-containing protein [Alphaproteobacteria bacterium]